MARPGALSRYAPPLALMALIFVLSAQPGLSSGLGTIDLVGRKLVHMAEFGLLFLLWLRALGCRRPAVAAAIAIGYAITDELHQTAVEGRVGSPVDVLIDATAVAVAWLLWRARVSRRAGGPPAPAGR
jgi:hypothetical protein